MDGTRHYCKRGAIRKYLLLKLTTLRPGKYALPKQFSARAVQMHLKSLGYLGTRGANNGTAGVSIVGGKPYLHVKNRRVEERREEPTSKPGTTNAPTA